MADSDDITIPWDEDLLERFQKNYDIAVAEGLESFHFEYAKGQITEFHVGYSKYLIEHLRNEFSR